MSIRRKQIRELVNNLLESNKILRPSVPVESIARNLGATIVEEPNEDDLSGFLLREPATRKITIGVNSLHSPLRRRFTIGHEIGHLLLHSEESFHIDRSSELFTTRKGAATHKFERKKDASGVSTTIEREANLFAAELLMPVGFVEADINRLGEIDVLEEPKLDGLADKYKVSLQALMYRLNYLGYLQL